MKAENNLGLANSEYDIIPPSVDVAEELARFAFQSWVDTYPNEDNDISLSYIKQLRSHRISPEGIQSLRERIERLKDDPSFFLRVAKNKDGHIVGFIDGENCGEYYELQDLFTDKSTFGNGLGQKLWQSYIAWVDPEKPVWLSVVPYTKRAPAFYKKIGFQTIPGSEGFYKDSKLPIIKMERPPEL